MSLGDTYISRFGLADDIPNKRALPLDLVRCSPEKDEHACGFLQLRHTTPYDLLYREYSYKSGVNQSMTDHLEGIVDSVSRMVNLAENEIVLDIGCNDGTLLNFYPDNLHRVGFEPSLNLAKETVHQDISVIPNYFNHQEYLARYSQKAQIVTSIAMFYDLDNPNAFVESVRNVLDENGVWVIELSYLPSMLSANAFDTIVHEHLGYYSFHVMEYLLSRHNITILKAELNDSNGGSFRLYCCHAEAAGTKYQIEPSSLKLGASEFELALETDAPYTAFEQRVQRTKTQTRDFLETAAREGKRTYVYGASTKGNTLLQYCGIDDSLVVAAADRNPYKWGKLWKGPNISVVSEEEARATSPDYFFVLPWHFKPEFMSRERDFLAAGGRFIFPLPDFQVVGAEK